MFGVREALVMHYQEKTDASAAPADLEAIDRLTTPFYTVDFDFRLSPT